MSTLSALAIQQVPIDELRPDSANPRRISDAELEALTRSIRQFGFVEPVLARSEDRTVIGGHQRLVAARKLGMTSVPVVFVDLSMEQARLLNLALNEISGAWDDELLARLLADLGRDDALDLTSPDSARTRSPSSCAPSINARSVSARRHSTSMPPSTPRRPRLLA